MRGATCNVHNQYKDIFQFQSTHPMRGATRANCCAMYCTTISIHAPHAGCDTAWMPLPEAYGKYFNPRTPCGVRRGKMDCVCRYVRFQSTHPMRGATHAIDVLLYMSRFQSTHPMRGATIHKPSMRYRGRFQSTHPMRGATGRCFCRKSRHQFQSTHPMRGATYPVEKYVKSCQFQSTHPMRGATAGRVKAKAAGYDFNPRTPCGVRPTASAAS